MEDDWEAENFEPKLEFVAPPVADKWKGEDEDDEVKESWEDEEDEKRDVEKAPVGEVKPKKKLEEKIAERERKRLEELERKKLERELEKEREIELTPEEQLAEKLRRQKLQEEADLMLAKETFGITDSPSIDSLNPSTKEEFSELSDFICKKVALYNKNPVYIDFLEELVRNLCVPLSSNDVKKIKTTIDNMLIEKQKVEKEKNKKGKGGKVKAKLKMDGELAAYGDFDDYDDFM